MGWAYVLIYTPIVLFVVAFLYETLLSFLRLRKGKGRSSGYVDATWEVTHTLLVFAIVMILMLFTKDIDRIADLIFLPTFLAATALAVRGACYLQIFYIRQKQRINWVDWVFALSHVVAAGLLVVVVGQVTWFLFTQHPTENSQFIPAFLPGLLLVLALCVVPLVTLYGSGKSKK